MLGFKQHILARRDKNILAGQYLVSYLGRSNHSFIIFGQVRIKFQIWAGQNLVSYLGRSNHSFIIFGQVRIKFHSWAGQTRVL